MTPVPWALPRSIVHVLQQALVHRAHPGTLPEGRRVHQRLSGARYIAVPLRLHCGGMEYGNPPFRPEVSLVEEEERRVMTFMNLG